MASARVCSASCSMCTLPRTCSNATNPSSHAVMAHSLLSSSLSRARSYSTARRPPPASPSCLKKKKAYTNQEAGIGVTTRSRPMQLPAQSKTSPGQQQSPTRGGVHPCSVGWRLMPIVARVPALRMCATVSTTSHHGQWSKGSFNIGGKEGHVLFQFTED
jgi:hypothetical protein